MQPTPIPPPPPPSTGSKITLVGIVVLLLASIFWCRLNSLGLISSPSSVQSSPPEASSRLDCTAINQKVYECDDCVLSDRDKSLAIECWLQEKADERGLTREQFVQEYRNKQEREAKAAAERTPVPSEVIDSWTIHRAEPQSKEDWDRLMREAKKRDAQYK